MSVIKSYTYGKKTWAFTLFLMILEWRNLSKHLFSKKIYINMTA